jgi:hypothetical protein
MRGRKKVHKKGSKGSEKERGDVEKKKKRQRLIER